MKRFMTIGLVLAAMTCFSVTTQAGWYRGYRGHDGGHGSYLGAQGHYVHRSIVHRTIHGTPHVNYHPARITINGHHGQYTPGYYDLHRTGHWNSYGHH